MAAGNQKTPAATRFSAFTRDFDVEQSYQQSRDRGHSARLRVFAIFAFSAAAEAAVYISYVASNGNDANPCTVVTAPCKTLTRALSVTPTNGTVRVLTALQSNVVINKSITISGDGAPIVGTITISGASIKVTLRGLELNGVGIIANGIRIDSAATVHIEDCSVERYVGHGIQMVATTATSSSFPVPSRATTAPRPSRR